MKKLIIIFVLVFLTANLNAQISSQQEAEIDRLFQKWNTKNSPGAAVGVIKDGRMVFSKGYGMADLEHNVPITPESVFYIASVSKQFVTMAILLLEEQGKLRLDDEVQKYLPDFPKYNDPLTIRHFIHHTSGVRDNLTLWSLAGKNIYDQVDKEAIYEMIKRQKELNFRPGEKYLYSNSCYFMLAKIVEKVSGLPIKEFADKNMFKPLGMNNTHFHDDQYHIVKDRVFSYRPSKNGFDNLIMRFDLVGSGGLYSNINDLFRWDQNFYNNKLGRGESGLTKKMHEEGLLNSGKSSGYAFGIVNGKHNGLRTVSHGGALAGYRTYSVRFPDQNFSVIVLANVSNFGPGSKAMSIADIFLKDKYAAKPTPKPSPETAKAKSVTPKSTESKFDAAQFQQFTSFYWSDEVNVSVKISIREGKPKFQRTGTPERNLAPVGKNEFTVVGALQKIELKFAKGKSGENLLFAKVNSGAPIRFAAYRAANYTGEELAQLSGIYFSEEINAFYLLKIEKGILTLYINEKKIGPLKPIMKNLFRNNQIGSFYLNEEKGQVTGFKLDAGRVKNLRFKKQ